MQEISVRIAWSTKYNGIRQKPSRKKKKTCLIGIHENKLIGEQPTNTRYNLLIALVFKCVYRVKKIVNNLMNH
jgi:hypothetical protein